MILDGNPAGLEELLVGGLLLGEVQLVLHRLSVEDDGQQPLLERLVWVSSKKDELKIHLYGPSCETLKTSILIV